ncbi:hypothetical protein C8R44DRAFT_984575 [Mycena epipterygia]|nr:hypothetical protein C8R44DRAFT_984575 [Mycena epipterygia]
MDSEHLSRLSDSTIQRIFRFFEDAELYDFSMTSRRMHTLALSMLLSRRNIPNPLEKVDIRLGDGSNTLQILRIALFIPSIRQLSVRFSPGTTSGMVGSFPQAALEQLQSVVECLLREMDRLHRLLEKLHSVDDIILVLPGSIEWNLRDMNRSSTSDIGVFPWSRVLSFLQKILDIHCTSFTVTTSTFMAYTPTAIPHPIGGSIHRLLRQLLHRRQDTDITLLPRWHGIKYSPQNPSDTTAIRSSSCVTNFSIENSLLLFPHSAGWTLWILKHSPITSLHISGLNISGSDWDRIASRLADAVPNLLELDFDDQQITPHCLLSLLDRLPRLTSLTIGPHMAVYLVHPRIFPPFSAWYLPPFRSLTKLSASTSYVSLFLMRRDPLPVLKSLALPPTDIYRIAIHHHASLYTHLPRIIRRLRDLNHILFPLPVTISFGRWANHGSHPLSVHIDASLALDVKMLDPLREITHLVLEDFDSMIDAQCFSRWLRLFPSLQQVSWHDSDIQRAEHVRIPPLAREISRSCPTVETIIAQGVRYSISSVLSSTEIRAQPTASLEFCDLPTEVLLIIFDFLYTELFHLSLLCRRLHFLALPIFLARNSISNPSEITTIDMAAMENSTVLRGLTVSLFVPSIKHLICIFPPPAYVYRHLDTIQRVTHLVRKLVTVEKLSLSWLGPGNATRENYQRGRLWEACYSALWDLLDAVHARSCTSLTLVGSPAAAEVRGVIPPPLASLNSVSNLSLNVDHFEPYSWWIFAALKQSPITTLHLAVMDGTNLDHVADFSSTLKTLSIHDYCTWAPRTEILNYLCRYPNITTLAISTNLYLSRNDPVGNIQVEGSSLHLDYLDDLTAPVSYISHFLQACHPFPALKRLLILVADLDDAWTLASLIEGIRERWPSSPTVTIEITDPGGVESITQDVNCISSLGGKWTHAVRQITALTVWYHGEWFRYAETGAVLHHDVFQLLVNWFSLFKGSRSIFIRGLDMAPSDSLFEFAESVGRALPGVQVVRFNEHTLFER